MNRKGLAVLSVSAVFVSLTTIGVARHSHPAAKVIISPVTAPEAAAVSGLFASTISAQKVKPHSAAGAMPLQPLNVTVLAARGSSFSDLASNRSTVKSLQKKTQAEILKARTSPVSPLDLNASQHTSHKTEIHTATLHKKTVHKAKVKTTPATKATKKTASHSVSPPSSRELRAARIALHYTGAPYRWGGSTPSGFDCSGLVRYVYARVGVSLPHSSFAMFHVGNSVSRQSLSPGDMVFFNTDGQGASHVGIYLGGNRFISAAGTDVRVSNLTGYWAQHYIGARRP